MHTIFYSEDLKGRDHVKDRRRHECNIKMNLKDIGREYGLELSDSGYGTILL
jgi:hypothetical protein